MTGRLLLLPVLGGLLAAPQASNDDASAKAPGMVSFGQVFRQGSVRPGRRMAVRLDDQLALASVVDATSSERAQTADRFVEDRTPLMPASFSKEPAFAIAPRASGER